MLARRGCLLCLLLVLAACSVEAADEPQPPVERAEVFAIDSPGGACLAAVAERVGDASLQVGSHTGEQVTVAVGPGRALWHCRSEVSEVAAPSGARQ